MWSKIKSIFILKKIFICVDIKIKLNISVYNKNIQRKLGINLVDFRRFSGRYKVEEYGETKEYNSFNNKLLFEGKYLNGKRNGKGIEYNEKRKKIFEGEYINGKRWKGIEIEYDEDTDKIIFEYEYINGKKREK